MLKLLAGLPRRARRGADFDSHASRKTASAANGAAGAGLFRRWSDANLLRTVPQTRLKSSFIYLANAVNDLRGNWMGLAAALAPLVLIAALCLLPEALNLQHRLAGSFGSGVHSVALHQVQMPYHSDAGSPPTPDPFPDWSIQILRVAFLLVTVIASLVVLCQLRRIEEGTRAASVIGEAIEVYRRSIQLAPAFLWVTVLQFLVPGVVYLLLQLNISSANPAVSVILSTLVFAMLTFAGLVYLWLYFAPYALIFDGQHSFHALLYSRDLMRKRFFSVAVRIVVFGAVWSGYNSWAIGASIMVSVLLSPMVALTGFIWTTVTLLNVIWLSVSFTTTAYFIAAGVRLYKDLCAIQAEGHAVTVKSPPESATVELNAAGA
jgi:hypothetical protein